MSADTDRAAAVAEEAKRLRQLRMVVDLTCNVLMQGRLPRDEAEDLVAAARRRALELFPDKEGTYELILALYERWIQTRSRRAATLLAERGIVPVVPNGGEGRPQ